MRVFHLELVPVSPARVGNFYGSRSGLFTMEVTAEDLPASKVISEGMYPLPDSESRSYSSAVSEELNKRFNTAEAYPEAISAAESDSLVACGGFAPPGHWSSAKGVGSNVQNVLFLDYTWSYEAITKLAYEFIRANWTFEIVRDLHIEKFGDQAFADARRTLKRLFPSVTIKDGTELSSFPYQLHHRPETFEEDHPALIGVMVRYGKYILRGTNLLNLLATEEGYLRVADNLEYTLLGLRYGGGVLAAKYNPIARTVYCVPQYEQKYYVTLPGHLTPLGITSDHSRFTATLEELDSLTTGDNPAFTVTSMFSQVKYGRKTRLGTIHHTPRQSLPDDCTFLKGCAISLQYSADDDQKTLTSLLKSLRLPFAGTKEVQVKRIARAIVDHMEFRVFAFDEFFEAPWLQISSEWSMYCGIKALNPFPVYQDSEPLDSYALALYILIHLHGGRIVQSGYVDKLFDPIEGALSLFNKGGVNLGVFIPVT